MGSVGTSISIADFHAARSCAKTCQFSESGVAGERRDVLAVLVKPVADLGIGGRCSVSWYPVDSVALVHGLASSRFRVRHPAVQHLLWQPFWVHPGDVADPSVVHHRLEVRDVESVEEFGGALAVPHRLKVEGPDTVNVELDIAQVSVELSRTAHTQARNVAPCCFFDILLVQTSPRVLGL